MGRNARRRKLEKLDGRVPQKAKAMRDERVWRKGVTPSQAPVGYLALVGYHRQREKALTLFAANKARAEEIKREAIKKGNEAIIVANKESHEADAPAPE